MYFVHEDAARHELTSSISLNRVPKQSRSDDWTVAEHPERKIHIKTYKHILLLQFSFQRNDVFYLEHQRDCAQLESRLLAGEETEAVTSLGGGAHHPPTAQPPGFRDKTHVF